MTTALHIIERAFSKAGVRASETPLEPSEVQDGLDALNDMLSTWDATGMLKGVFPVEAVESIVNVPRFAEWAIKANLSLILAGEYSKTVTPAMINDATQSRNGMVVALVDFDDIKLPETLPTGSGNKTRGYGDFYDFYAANQRNNF